MSYDTAPGISIHAAREGGDLKLLFRRCMIKIFQSTPPVKAATSYHRLLYLQKRISIHAAREGGDGNESIVRMGEWEFQSTPPVKAATAETNRRNQHFRKQQV